MAQTLTPQEQDQRVLEWGRLRDRARQDLFFLANEILSPPESRIMVHHAHDIIVNHCQKFFGWKEFFAVDKQGHFIIHSKTGMPVPTLQQPRVKMWDLPGSRDNLLLVSRGHLKTTIHTVAHIIQWIINYPDVRILMCTATDEKAQIIVGKTKQHFQYNPRFRHLFPEFCPPKSKISDWGSKTEFSVPNRTRNDEPTLMTAAVGKALASTHHDVIKCSDVVTENNVRTDGQIQEVKDFFGYMEPLRERGPSKDGEPNPGWKDVEGTIYHFADAYSMILDVESGRSEEKKAWKITKQSCWVDDAKTIPLWPERFPAKELHRIEDSPEVGPVLFACTPGDAPILMSDFSEKPISDIQIGDEIVGYQFGKQVKAGPEYWTRIVKAKVLEKTWFAADVLRVHFEDGTSVRCTADHKWYTGRIDKGHKSYDVPKIGRRFVQVVPPLTATGEQLDDWRYLAGIIDGEGGCRHQSSVYITQSEKANPAVHAEIQATLNRLDIPFGTYRRKDAPTDLFHLEGGRPMLIKLLRFGRLAKRQQIIDGIWKHRTRITHAENKIINIQPEGREVVYGLRTTTGNYVSQGYASQNSQYELNPITGVDGLAKLEQIKFFPAKLIQELMPRYRVHTTVDLSNMDPTTDGDATVFSTCGFDGDGRCDVLSIIKGRFTLDEVVQWFFRIDQVYPNHISFKVQKDHFSRTLWPILQREQAKRGKWLNITLTPVSTRISKQQRIRGLQAWFMQGLIRFADNISCKKDLINEILRFPKGAHDDILDTLADQMHNRDGGPSVDVYPDAQKYSMDDLINASGRQRFTGPQFQGFDPISQEARWLHDVIEGAHSAYDSVTGV